MLATTGCGILPTEERPRANIWPTFIHVGRLKIQAYQRNPFHNLSGTAENVAGRASRAWASDIPNDCLMWLGSVFWDGVSLG